MSFSKEIPSSVRHVSTYTDGLWAGAILGMAIATILFYLAGCETSTAPSPGELAPNELSVPQTYPTYQWDGVQNDTAVVQAAATAGTCLPPGDYVVVTGPRPRHDYIILGGARGCDASSAPTIYFVGDAAGSYWAGLAPRTGDSVRHIRLDTTALVNADPNGKDGLFEQSHVVHIYTGVSNVTISDVWFRSTTGGDCVNSVGPAHPPWDTGLVVSDNTFERCHRGAIFLARGLQGTVIARNRSLDAGFSLGSEGAGGWNRDTSGAYDGTVTQTILNTSVYGNYFTSPRSTGIEVQLEWWNGVDIYDNVSDSRPWEIFGTDNVEMQSNTLLTQFSTMEAFLVGDWGYHIHLTGGLYSSPVGAFAVRQLGRGRPLDGSRLGDITVDGGGFLGDIALRGVAGASIGAARLAGSVVQSCGLSSTGQCIAPTTGVVVVP